jgi:hypothetical protein
MRGPRGLRRWQHTRDRHDRRASADGSDRRRGSWRDDHFDQLHNVHELHHEQLGERRRGLLARRVVWHRLWNANDVLEWDRQRNLGRDERRHRRHGWRWDQHQRRGLPERRIERDWWRLGRLG